jgi:hypothetical protein
LWRDFPVGKATWIPYSYMAVNMQEMMTKSIESHDDPDIVSKMRSVWEFSWVSVLQCQGWDLCRDHSPKILMWRQVVNAIATTPAGATSHTRCSWVVWIGSRSNGRRWDPDGKNLITDECFGFECFGPRNKVFYWTASHLSENHEWDIAEGGGILYLMSLPRWHHVFIYWSKYM